MVIGNVCVAFVPNMVVIYGELSSGYSGAPYVTEYVMFAPSNDHTAVNAVEPICGT